MQYNDKSSLTEPFNAVIKFGTYLRPSLVKLPTDEKLQQVQQSLPIERGKTNGF
jgi:hypothetical protein